MNKVFPAQSGLMVALALVSSLAAAQSASVPTPGPTPAERGVLADPGNGPFVQPDMKPRPRPQLKPRMNSDELKLESRPELRPEMSPGMQPNSQKPLRPRNPAVRDNLSSQAPLAPPVDPRDSTSRPASLPNMDPQRDVSVPGTAAPGAPASAPAGTASAPVAR